MISHALENVERIARSGDTPEKKVFTASVLKCEFGITIGIFNSKKYKIHVRQIEFTDNNGWKRFIEETKDLTEL